MRLFAFIRIALFGLIVLGSFAVSGSVEAQDTQYTVTDIGTLVGTSNGQFDSLTNVSPNDINADGVVVANALPADSTFWAVPFTSTDGKVKRLGKERAYSYATGINDDGDVVGYTTTLEDTTQDFTKAVVWRDRKPIDLPSLGGDASNASAINNDGTIVGQSDIAPGIDASYHAVLWQDDEVHDLGALGGEVSVAEAINDNGVVVGRSQVADRAGLFPFVWEDGTLTELATPDDFSGDAAGINDDGVIVGFAFDANFMFYAVRWIDQEPAYLPTFSDAATGAALAINTRGQIVGYSTAEADPSLYIAVLWEGETIVDLNTRIPADIGYVLTNAQAVNDAGQITASGAAPDGTPRSVLLTPVDSDTGQTGSPLAAVPIADLRNAF